jgi:hypothetical protein
LLPLYAKAILVMLFIVCGLYVFHRFVYDAAWFPRVNEHASHHHHMHRE